MKIKDAVTDIREMRKKIHDAAYRGWPVDGDGNHYKPHPPSCNIARSILTQAEAYELSGEDAMTFLAFEMMKYADNLFNNMLKAEMCKVVQSTYFILSPDAPQHSQESK